MTPAEKEQFDLVIYLEGKKHHGYLENAADYLRLKDSTKLSRLINPNDARANNIFSQVSEVLEGIDYKNPELEEFIWEKLVLRRNVYKNTESVEQAKLAEIIHEASLEQLDVNFAKARGASLEVLEMEAFQAFERSKRQYEAIVAARSKTPIQESSLTEN